MIDLLTLGPAAAYRDGAALNELLADPDAFALLVYLCLEGPTSRTRLLALWEQEGDDPAAALAAAVTAARRAVGADVLLDEGEHLRCAEGAVRCDAVRLEDAAAAGDWAAVARLYRGPFLADVRLPAGHWTDWRDAVASRTDRLWRHAASQLRTGAEPRAIRRSRSAELLDRLRERRIVQVAAVYVAAAWAGLTVFDTLIERGLLPEWVFVTALGVAAVGLAAALAVAWAQEVESLGPIGDTGAVPWLRRAARPAGLAAMAGALILFLGTYAVLHRTVPEGADAPAAPDLRRVGILYFDDYSVEQDLAPVAAGFTDAVIHHLAQVPALDVPSRNAVKPHRMGVVSLDSLVRSLRLGAYVEGALRRGGDSLYVTVQLIDAASGSHLDSQTLGAPARDVLLLRDELAEEIARLLRKRLGAEVRLREARADARDAEAWLLVQRAGMRLDDARAVSESDRSAAARAHAAADSLLALAERRDPRWPAPTVQRGWVALELGFLEAGTPGIIAEAPGRQALRHAERAVARFPEEPAALELRGAVRFELAEAGGAADAEEPYASAGADLQAALAADPERARAWLYLSRVHRRTGRFAEARRAAQRALEADYYLTEAEDVTWSLHHTSLELRDGPAAERWCDEGRRRWPDRPRFLLCRLLVQASFPRAAGDVAAAWSTVDTLVELTPDAQREMVAAYGRMFIAQVAAQAGLADSARSIIRATRATTPPDLHSLLAYNEAHVHLLLGEPARALDLLEMHVRDYPSRGGDYLAKDWWWTELRDSARFAALVAGGAGDDDAEGDD